MNDKELFIVELKKELEALQPFKISSRTYRELLDLIDKINIEQEQRFRNIEEQMKKLDIKHTESTKELIND